MAFPWADDYLSVPTRHGAHLLCKVRQFIDQATIRPLIDDKRIVVAHKNQNRILLLDSGDVCIESMLANQLVATVRVTRLVSQQEVIDRNEQNGAFTSVKEHMSALGRADPIEVVLRAELAQKGIWVVDLTTDDLAVTIDWNHLVLCRVNVRT